MDDTDFYVLGGTLSWNAISYIARRADDLLFTSLLKREFCYILTSRQMGKSSLMVRTAAKLRAQNALVAVVDLTGPGQNVTVEQWYKGILNRIGTQCDLEEELEDFWQDHYSLPPLERWMSALHQVILLQTTSPFILFIDEIELVRSLPFKTDEFFASIRACYNRRAMDPEFTRLTFCLLGVAVPADLIDNVHITPFNIGTRIELQDFTRREASPLSAGLSRSGKEADELLDRIFYWTEGHPYLTQCLCAAVAEDETAQTAQDVDRHCSALYFAAVSLRRETNLSFVSERLLRSEVDIAGLLELYLRIWRGRRMVYDETNPLFRVLRLSGVVTLRNGGVVVRNRIYAHVFDRRWIAENMPDAELRRQRSAYRRGALRTLGMVGAILVTMAGLSLFALQQRNEARHNASKEKTARTLADANADLAEYRLYCADMNLIQREWEANAIDHVRELLEETRANKSRGFEWGYWNRLCHLDLRTLSGHTDMISSVACSPDGARILTGSYDRSAKVWNAQTGRELLTLTGHTGKVRAVAFSHDGSSLLTGSSDRSVRVWEARTGRVILRLNGHTGFVTSVAFSSDGKRIVSGSGDHTAKVWDIATGRNLITLKGHTGGIGSVAASPDGKRIVTGSNDFTAKIWDAATGHQKFTLRGHSGPVLSVAFSPDGKKIVTASVDSTAKVWDAGTGRNILTLRGHAGFVNSAAFSPNGKRIVTGSYDRSAKVWDARSGQEIFTVRGHLGSLTSVCFFPNGSRIVTGSEDNTAKIWDGVVDRQVRKIVGHTDFISSVGFSPDGKWIVTGSGAEPIHPQISKDNTAKIWNAKTGREIHTLKGHTTTVTSAAFSFDGTRVVTGSWDNSAKVWNARTGHAILTLTGHKGAVFCIAIAHDDKRILTGSNDNTAKIWDAGTGHPILTLKGHTGTVTSVGFSPDDRLVVTGGYDGTARIWDSQTGREIQILKGHTGPFFFGTFSPDGKRIITGGYGNLATMWDASTGRELFTLKGHAGILSSVAFSSDGKRIITGSIDKMAKVWDAGTGREVLTLMGHTNVVTSVAFAPDGRSVVTGSRDKTVRVWEARFD